MSETILTKFASRYASQPAMPQAPMGGYGMMSTSAHMPSMMGMGPNSGIAQAANAAQKNPNPLTKMSPGKHGLATASGISQAAQQAQTSNQTPQQAPMQPQQPQQMMPQQQQPPTGMMPKMGSLEAPDNWLLALVPLFLQQVKQAETQTSGAQATTSGTTTVGNAGQTGTQNAQMGAQGTKPGRVGSQNQQGQMGGGGGSGMQGAMQGQFYGGGGQVGAYGVVKPGWASLRPSSSPFAGVTSPTTKLANWVKSAMGLPPTPGLTANQPMPQPGMAPPPPGLPAMPPPNGGAPIPGTMGQPSVDPMTGAPMPPGGPGGAVDPATGMPMDPAAAGGPPPGAPPQPTQPDPKTGQPSTSPMQDPPPLPLPSNPRMMPPRPQPTQRDVTQQGTMHSLMQDKAQADIPMNGNEATEDIKNEAMAMGSKTASVRPLLRSLGLGGLGLAGAGTAGYGLYSLSPAANPQPKIPPVTSQAQPAAVLGQPTTLRKLLSDHYSKVAGGLDRATASAISARNVHKTPNYTRLNFDQNALDKPIAVNKDTDLSVAGSNSNVGQLRAAYDIPSDSVVINPSAFHTSGDMRSTVEHEATHGRLQGADYFRGRTGGADPMANLLSRKDANGNTVSGAYAEGRNYIGSPTETDVRLAQIKRLYARHTGTLVETPEQAKDALNWYRANGEKHDPNWHQLGAEMQHGYDNQPPEELKKWQDEASKRMPQLVRADTDDGSKFATDQYRILAELGLGAAMSLKSGFWKSAAILPAAASGDAFRLGSNGQLSPLGGGGTGAAPANPMATINTRSPNIQRAIADATEERRRMMARSGVPYTEPTPQAQGLRPRYNTARTQFTTGGSRPPVPPVVSPPDARKMALLGGLGAIGLGALAKQGSQDDDGNKDTAKSATGESKGLKYQYKADHHAQGQDAWESVSQYFKGHGKRGKNQPNPSLGKHANDALKALLGEATSKIDIPRHTIPAPLNAMLNPDTPRDVPRVALSIPLLAGLSGLGLGYAGGHMMGKKKGRKEATKEAAYAELTPFAQGFFAKCDEVGVDHASAVEKVGSDFGEEAANELRDGLIKLAGPKEEAAKQGINWFGRLIGVGAKPGAAAAPRTMTGGSGTFGNFWKGVSGQTPQAMPGTAGAFGARTAAIPTYGATRSYQAGAAINRFGQGVGQYGGMAGKQLAPTAGGALMGGFAGDSMGLGGDSLEILPGIKLNYRGMMAGGAASNPFLRRRANSFAGGTFSMPMAGMRAAGIGSMGGGAFDQLAGALGYDTGGAGARLGAWGGFGLGTARQGVRLAPNWAGGTTSGLSRLNTNLGAAERGMGNFTNESFKGFFKPITYPFRAGYNYIAGKPIGSVMGGAAKGGAGRLGRAIGVGTLGATGIGTTYGLMKDKLTGEAREAVGQMAGEMVPELQDQAASFMDQYMMSRGMMDETGQFNPMMAANRQGGIMGGIMRGSDDIFRAIGMDPSRMSPLQKLMILGGTAAAGGGALAGAPALAGVGGVSALAGLLPQLMPSQSQQVMGNGTQAPYRPGQQQQGQAGVTGVNGIGPQGPQARNEWQMFQQPTQFGG